MTFEVQMSLTGSATMTPRERVWVGENSYISLNAAVVTANKRTVPNLAGKYKSCEGGEEYHGIGEALHPQRSPPLFGVR